MEKLVSVCIPAYNGEKFIKETIEMVRKQEYQNLEILVSDDASSDHTVDVVRSIDDSRIRLVTNDKNAGLGGNWNRLIVEAKGDYVLLVCHDDYIYPSAIQKKVQALEENQNASLAFSSSYVMDGSGKTIMLRRPFRGTQVFQGAKLQKKLFTHRNYLAEPMNVMMRKTAVDLNGKYDENLWYNIDYDYWLRLLNFGDAVYIDEPLSAFRIMPSTATGSNLKGPEAIMKDEEVFVNKYKDGAYFPMTEAMLKQRSFHIQGRLFMKIFFMRLYSIFKKG